MAAPPSTRVPGRPRDPSADRAILDATIRLLLEQGYDAMSVEGVAAAAGVGKTTIYRRFPGKRELVVASIASIAASLEPPLDSGSTRRDLYAFVDQTLGVLRSSGLGFSMMGTLLAKERTEPALLEMFRTAIIAPRVAVATDLVRRGIERGELRSDIPAEVAVQMIVGASFARHLAGLPEEDGWLDAVFDTVWRGIATV